MNIKRLAKTKTFYLGIVGIVLGIILLFVGDVDGEIIGHFEGNISDTEVAVCLIITSVALLFLKDNLLENTKIKKDI